MNQATLPKFGIGAPVRRKEDQAFVTGSGSYVDDYAPADSLFGYMVRSPIAHARFKINNLDEIRTSIGVKLVVLATDISHFGDMPVEFTIRQANGEKFYIPPRRVLCTDTVRHIGDGIAFIVADTLNNAKSAAELLDIDYDPIDAVIGIEEALKEGAQVIWPEVGSNLAFHFDIGDKAKTEQVFSSASKTTSIKIENNRLIANYMEPRGCVAEFDPDSGRYTLRAGTQGGHAIRDVICNSIMKIDPNQMRLITPDVGGGFGTKIWTYREYPLSCFAAEKLRQPIKWTADRTDHFLSDSQGRDNITEAEFALDERGKIIAMRAQIYADMGGYLHQFGPGIPHIGATMTTGPYNIDVLHVDIFGVYTNSVPTDAYRGAGRPEAAYVLERLVEKTAVELGMSQAEFRKINFIQPESFPYKTQTNYKYDNGEFVGQMEQSLKNADWDGFEVRENESKKRGLFRGRGMATYIEVCAFAGSEEANLVLNENGTVTLFIGTQTNGQGHMTAYGQVLADIFGLDLDRVDVIQGDTDQVRKGGGTGGSRSVPLAIPSITGAGKKLVEQIKQMAAAKLESSADDLELVDGEVRIVGTDRKMTLAEVAQTAEDKEMLKAQHEVNQEENTYPNGTHVCEVEIDPETGKIELERYTIVDDFGVVVNPILLEGQVHGGVTQSIGQVLLEKTVYDDSGQLLTASFMDYAIPRAADVVSYDFKTRNVPSTNNAAGIKGAGEAGTIGATPAVMNAVVDALRRGAGVTHIDMPVTPERVWSAINSAKN